MCNLPTKQPPLSPPCYALVHCLPCCFLNPSHSLSVSLLCLQCSSTKYVRSLLFHFLQAIHSNAILQGKFYLTLLSKKEPPNLYTPGCIVPSFTVFFRHFLVHYFYHLFVLMLIIHLSLLVHKLNEGKYLSFTALPYCLKQYDSCNSTQIYVKSLN